MTIHSETETPGKARQVITVDAHSLYADETGELGGTAPSPHDYFDAALATCKAVTAHIYARAHGIALERVVLDVERDASQERQGTYVLTVKLRYEGALSEEDKERVHKVIERCPLHKLMTTTTVEIRQERELGSRP